MIAPSIQLHRGTSYCLDPLFNALLYYHNFSYDCCDLQDLMRESCGLYLHYSFLSLHAWRRNCYCSHIQKNWNRRINTLSVFTYNLHISLLLRNGSRSKKWGPRHSSLKKCKKARKSQMLYLIMFNPLEKKSQVAVHITHAANSWL